VGIVGGIDIQQDDAALAYLLAANTDELVQQKVIELYQAECRDRVLPAA